MTPREETIALIALTSSHPLRAAGEARSASPRLLATLFVQWIKEERR